MNNNNILQRYLKSIRANRKKYGKWLTTFISLALAVIVTTSAVLTLSGIAVTYDRADDVGIVQEPSDDPPALADSIPGETEDPQAILQAENAASMVGAAVETAADENSLTAVSSNTPAEQSEATEAFPAVPEMAEAEAAEPSPAFPEEIPAPEATEVSAHSTTSYAEQAEAAYTAPENENTPTPALYPAQSFEAITGDMTVTVSADEGAFPEGTYMVVTPVAAETVTREVEAAVAAEVTHVEAVDISFYNQNDEKIEPLIPIRVKMHSASLPAIEDPLVVHLKNDGDAEVVEKVAPEQLAREALEAADETIAEVADEELSEQLSEAAAALPADELQFNADNFSVYVITAKLENNLLATDGQTYRVSLTYTDEAQIPEDSTLQIEEITPENYQYDTYVAQTADALESAAGRISYAKFVDITILHDGEEVHPAAPVDVKFELLTQDALENENNPETLPSVVHFGKEEVEVIDAGTAVVETVDQTQEMVEVKFEAGGFSVYGVVYTVDFFYYVDGHVYEVSLIGGDTLSFRFLVEKLRLLDGVKAGDGADADSLIDDIESVRFSDESLVKVIRISEDMTAGELKDKYGLQPEYSAGLQPEMIEAMNAKVFTAPDWILVSLKAFNTEETLTVTLKNGEVFTVKVTDAQTTDPLGLDQQTYVIAASGNAMKAETNDYGQLNSHATDGELGDLYDWKFEFDPTVPFGTNPEAPDSTGGYYLTCDGRYIHVDEANYISLVEDKAEATPFKVTFDSSMLSSDNYAKGRYQFSANGSEGPVYLDYTGAFGISATASDSTWFTLMDPDDPGSMPGHVGTWDILGDGIVLKMYDYSGTVNNNNIDGRNQWGNGISESTYRSGWGINHNRGLIFSGSGLNGLNGTNVSKPNQFTGEWNQSNNAKVYNKMANQGIVKQTLNAAGYPVLQNNYWQSADRADQGSLGYLFGAGGQQGVTAYEGAGGKGLQGLFRKDANGDYYYDSEWNYARMNSANTEILLYSDTYKKDKETDGHERKEKIGFFPFTDYDTSKREEKGPAQEYYNHQFGTSMHTDFYYPSGGVDPETNRPMRFEFSGDDDVWVFVDGVLVLDMGGVHQPVKGVVDFSTRTSTVYEYDYNGNAIVTTKTFDELFAGSGKTFSTKNYSKHSLDFFYLERGGCDSNCSIRFNLIVTKTLYLKKEITGLDLLPEEEREAYKNMVFTLELNTRDTAEGTSVPFGLFETADPDNTNAAVNYTVRTDARGNVLEQGFPIKNGQITIRDGETVAIGKLPPSIQYYVSEEKTEVLSSFMKPLARDRKEKNLKLSSGKSVYYKNVLNQEMPTWKTGNQNIKTNDTVKYINRIPETNLDVVKDWQDTAPVDHSADTVYFTVSASIPGEGNGADPVPYPVSAVDGIEFTLNQAGNWQKAINHLPDKTPDGKQITYTVKEKPVSGYLTSVKVTQASEEADDKRVGYTIENKPFELTVKKNWAGDWLDEDRNAVSPIRVTLKRYIQKDKENLVIHSGYNVNIPEGFEPDGFAYHADYQVLDENGSVAATVSSGGEDIVLSLPDGTYTVVQTTTDPENGYDVAHSPVSRTVSGLTVTADTQAEAVFCSDYTRHTGILTVKSNVTDETGTFNADYVVCDENDQEVGRCTYAEAAEGKEFTLPIGTYHVKENVTTVPGSSTLRSQGVTPENAAQTLVKPEEGVDRKEVIFSRVYERIVDSNNTYEIHHLQQYGNALLASGSIPPTYPAGTKIRLSFQCYNGNWLTRDQSAQYNGQSLTVTGRKLSNGNAEFSVEYTLVQNRKLQIWLNANPYDSGNANKFVPNSVRIEVINSLNSIRPARTLMTARRAPEPLRTEAVQRGDLTLVNGADVPDPGDDTKKYIQDSWSREIELTAGENWEKKVAGLEAVDENGNPYYYYIEKVEEPNMRTDAEAAIDISGGEKILVSKDNMSAPLTFTNTISHGALKITKNVTVNDIAPNELNQSLASGTFVFEVAGASGGATADVSHTVRVTFENGNAVKYRIDSREETPVAGTGNTWFVVIPDLPVGNYTVTETSSGNMTLKNVTGGSSVSGNTATLTVISKDTVPVAAAAQAVFTNNAETGSLKVVKTVSLSGVAASELPDAAKSREYLFTVRNADGKYLQSDRHTFGDDEYVFTVSMNQPQEFTELPVSTYTVTEKTEEGDVEYEGYLWNRSESTTEAETALEAKNIVQADLFNYYDEIYTPVPADTNEFTEMTVDKDWVKADGGTSPEENDRIKIKIRARSAEAGIPIQWNLYDGRGVTEKNQEQSGICYVDQDSHVQFTLSRFDEYHSPGTGFNLACNVPLTNTSGITRTYGNSIPMPVNIPSGAWNTRNKTYSIGADVTKGVVFEAQPWKNTACWVSGTPSDAGQWHLDVAVTDGTRYDSVDAMRDALIGENAAIENLVYVMDGSGIHLVAEESTFSAADLVTSSFNSDNWAASLAGLPAYLATERDGVTSYRVYDYEIEEIEVNGVPVVNGRTDDYLVSVTHPAGTENTVTITNTQRIKVDADAEKVWANAEGSAEAPENGTVTFELYADGAATGKMVELNGKTDAEEIAALEAIEADDSKPEEEKAAAAAAKAELQARTYGEFTAWKAVWHSLPKYSDDAQSTEIVYTIKEVEGFEGYANQNESGVSSGGTITNLLTSVDFDLLKVDSETDRPLEGAYFTIQQVEETSSTAAIHAIGSAVPGTPQETGSDGKTRFTGVTDGCYEIRETKPPKGYVLTGEGTFYVKVENGTVTLMKKVIEDEKLSLQPAESATVGNVTITPASGTTLALFTVENTAGAALPHTGGSGTRPFTILGSAFLLAAGLLLIRRRKTV